MVEPAILIVSLPAAVCCSIACGLAFCSLFSYFWLSHRGISSFYFDPQDFWFYEKGGGRELPVAAQTSTFEPLLKSYIDVTKLLITVAAASIAFGGNQQGAKQISTAKIILAFSILYGVLFCAVLHFFYDQYTQNVRAYTRCRYSLIEALGFSTLFCFIAGYFFWAFNLI